VAGNSNVRHADWSIWRSPRYRCPDIGIGVHQVLAA
jgi:hypothetical protein